jgi:serine/threonine-protein kinase
MAPEQAQGEEVDHRADLFAFGSVLYEMATGRQPFAGKNVYDTIGRIVSDEPSAVSEIDPSLPAQLQWIVRKCLAKEPAKRYQGAGDLAVDLGTLAGDAKSGIALPPGGGTRDAGITTTNRTRPVALLAVVAAAALLFGALGSWALLRPAPAEPAPVRRFILPVPESQRLPSNTPPLAISPDGTSLVTLAISGGERWLELRRMDQLEAREMPGTRDVGGSPFFSPDGRRIGFETENRIYRASLVGEPPQTLFQAEVFRGATWTDADQIVYSDADRLFVVDAAGGDSRPVPAPDTDEPAALRWPAALPGGRHVLATRADTPGAFSTVLVELASGQIRELIAQGSGARYAAGYVVYGRDRFLFAAPFDSESLELTGEPVPMVEGVQTGGSGQVHFDVSGEGTLVYSPSRDGSTGFVTRLALTDRDGGVTVLPLPLESHWEGRLSPDGRRVAVATGARGNTDIFVYDVQRGAAQRLTAGDGFSREPAWSPDGSWIYFAADRAGVRGIYRQRADAMAGEELGMGGQHRLP